MHYVAFVKMHHPASFYCSLTSSVILTPDFLLIRFIFLRGLKIGWHEMELKNIKMYFKGMDPTPKDADETLGISFLDIQHAGSHTAARGLADQ